MRRIYIITIFIFGFVVFLLTGLTISILTTPVKQELSQKLNLTIMYHDLSEFCKSSKDLDGNAILDITYMIIVRKEMYYETLLTFKSLNEINSKDVKCVRHLNDCNYNKTNVKYVASKLSLIKVTTDDFNNIICGMRRFLLSSSKDRKNQTNKIFYTETLPSSLNYVFKTCDAVISFFNNHSSFYIDADIDEYKKNLTKNCTFINDNLIMIHKMHLHSNYLRYNYTENDFRNLITNEYDSINYFKNILTLLEANQTMKYKALFKNAFLTFGILDITPLMNRGETNVENELAIKREYQDKLKLLNIANKEISTLKIKEQPRLDQLKFLNATYSMYLNSLIFSESQTYNKTIHLRNVTTSLLNRAANSMVFILNYNLASNMTTYDIKMSYLMEKDNQTYERWE